MAAGNRFPRKGRKKSVIHSHSSFAWSPSYLVNSETNPLSCATRPMNTQEIMAIRASAPSTHGMTRMRNIDLRRAKWNDTMRWRYVNSRRGQNEANHAHAQYRFTAGESDQSESNRTTVASTVAGARRAFKVARVGTMSFGFLFRLSTFHLDISLEHICTFARMARTLRSRASRVLCTNINWTAST